MDSIRSLVLVISLALLGGSPVLADVLLMEGIQSAPAIHRATVSLWGRYVSNTAIRLPNTPLLASRQ
jgi:hypothetical protein